LDDRVPWDTSILGWRDWRVNNASIPVGVNV
jgi:hypothetical protein